MGKFWRVFRVYVRPLNFNQIKEDTHLKFFKQDKWVGFSYDARGNMIKGDGLTSAHYNAMDKPTLITKNGVTSEFVYGPDNMRFMQVKGDTTTYYAGKHYELEIENGEFTERAYIDGVALVSKTDDYQAQIRYMHRDRLGSARLMTDRYGNVVVERNFDPFGKPRSSNGSLKFEARLGDKGKARTNRGFTDHEHLDELELIHMNGRVYDYNLGRFMSVDPYIQSPKNSQSINPYSYIMNNPLAGTDPTGYTGCTASRLNSICENTSVHHGGNDNFGNMGAIATQMGDAAMSKARFTAYANLNMNIIKSWMSKQTSEQMDIASPQGIAAGGVAIGKATVDSGAGGLLKSVTDISKKLLPSLGKGGITGVALMPMTTATDEEMYELTRNVVEENILHNRALDLKDELSKTDFARLENDLAGIRAKPDGPKGEQYALIAEETGDYVCFTCSGGTKWLNKGDVWKYGETTNPSKRYSNPQLLSGLAGRRLRKVTQYEGTKRQILLAEKLKIYTHLAKTGVLPPGNKIRR
ncbi:hypothetical protein N480_22405 [Pseudoalteromonas luteoviolacea S2607]|uniref:RHS repeat domain-containing protein n=1 Tax=Pseudoalteromonas luteoviolacea TaxID=43657 RepID=UPI0007B0C03D|nr:RHS repeat-associated core domain-containing protein [Pseudoalteromonas luteoviolacea]KZN34358.1 hypothetical protein N480_22405 [Pseudoalteromonas luteoviolacea S2607]